MAGSLVWSGLYGFWTFSHFSFLFWIASCSLFHHHHSKERVGWEEIPLMSGHVYFWLLGCSSTSTCHCLRVLSPASSSLGSLVSLFLTSGEREGQGVPLRMCVDIAVCVPTGPVDRRPRSLGETRHLANQLATWASKVSE